MHACLRGSPDTTRILQQVHVQSREPMQHACMRPSHLTALLMWFLPWAPTREFTYDMYLSSYNIFSSLLFRTLLLSLVGPPTQCACLQETSRESTSGRITATWSRVSLNVHEAHLSPRGETTTLFHTTIMYTWLAAAASNIILLLVLLCNYYVQSLRSSPLYGIREIIFVVCSLFLVFSEKIM